MKNEKVIKSVINTIKKSSFTGVRLLAPWNKNGYQYEVNVLKNEDGTISYIRSYNYCKKGKEGVWKSEAEASIMELAQLYKTLKRTKSEYKVVSKLTV